MHRNSTCLNRKVRYETADNVFFSPINVEWLRVVEVAHMMLVMMLSHTVAARRSTLHLPSNGGNQKCRAGLNQHQAFPCRSVLGTPGLQCEREEVRIVEREKYPIKIVVLL